MTITATGVRPLAKLASSVILGLALLTTACGSDGGETEASGTQSPLSEFLGQPDFLGDPEAAQAQIIEEERVREEAVAQCMQAQGFEYIPQDSSQFISFEEDFDDWGSEEWVAEWGFGITTQWFSQSQVGPNLKGYDDSQFDVMDEAEEFQDPNQDYLTSLSPEEQEAYYAALYGDEDTFLPGIDDSMSEEEIEAQLDELTFEPQGCQGEAWAAQGIDDFYTEFREELRAMEERVEADARVVERRQEISQCVAEKGHDYESMDELYERYFSRVEELDPYAAGDFTEPELSITEEELNAMSEEELDEFYRQEFTEPELTDEAKATLAELQAEEIELAVAVTECGGGFDAEFELTADIRAEYEREFLDTYADELEQYRAG